MTRLSWLWIAAVWLLPSAAFAQSWTESWLSRVSATQAEQPHWVTPLVTVTPRLEQEVRYDISHQAIAGGQSVWNIGGGKGLELIPTRRTEVIISVPPYFARTNPVTPSGFGDMSFLLKYRLASANEEHGNYIVSAFIGAAVPTGDHRNGAPSGLVTPTIAAGKGFGRVSLQSTVSVTFPTSEMSRTGHPVAFNVAAQYHVRRFLWPEVEANSTFFAGGPNDGRKQVFLTPGLVLGRFPIHHRVGFTLGAGMQIAATHFHTFNHNAILSARLPF